MKYLFEVMLGVLVDGLNVDEEPGPVRPTTSFMLGIVEANPIFHYPS